MVKEIEKNGKILYVCEECKFAYEDKSWAEKCQAWCKKTNTCNIMITKHSIGPVLKK